VLWREVARRAARENAGFEHGDEVAVVAQQIAQDVATFKQIMRRLHIPVRRAKPFGAVVAERIGRLKLNGRLFGYSPLSRFVELDFLAMGIDGKKIMWANLRDLAQLRDGVPDVDFGWLIERARHQRELLEPLRERAGEEALGLRELAAQAAGRTAGVPVTRIPVTVSGVGVRGCRRFRRSVSVSRPHGVSPGSGS
jgi:hypothetical protein